MGCGGSRYQSRRKNFFDASLRNSQLNDWGEGRLERLGDTHFLVCLWQCKRSEIKLNCNVVVAGTLQGEISHKNYFLFWNYSSYMFLKVDKILLNFRPDADSKKGFSSMELCGWTQKVACAFAKGNENSMGMNGQNTRGRIRLVSWFVTTELQFLFHSRWCVWFLSSMANELELNCVSHEVD